LRNRTGGTYPVRAALTHYAGSMAVRELVPAVEGSALALSLVELDSDSLVVADAARDSLLVVVAGAGSLTLGDETLALTADSAGLVQAGEEGTIAAESGLSFLHATVGEDTDRHAPLGPRATVVGADDTTSEEATGTRSFRVLFGPANGSTRATLFAGSVPPGRASWHFHLYDEIVWVRGGSARLHLADGAEEFPEGTAFRLRPRQVHIVESASECRGLDVVGIFTPAGSPSAAYLAPAPA
jgi:mannose-6-phosphate isomerase-like protein (cupin superfamily)